MEIKNALISSAKFDTERGLSCWIMLDYGDCSVQRFGGYMIYIPKKWAGHTKQWNYAGHFIYRVLQIAGVDDWNKLVGKSVKAKVDNGLVVALGHIIKDDWFEPRVDFAEFKTTGGQ